MNARNPSELSENMELNALKMFLSPLSDTDILALYCPTPSEAPKGGTSCGHDPTIEATKFLAGHSTEESPVLTSSLKESPPEKVMEEESEELQTEKTGSESNPLKVTQEESNQHLPVSECTFTECAELQDDIPEVPMIVVAVSETPYLTDEAESVENESIEVTHEEVKGDLGKEEGATDIKASNSETDNSSNSDSNLNVLPAEDQKVDDSPVENKTQKAFIEPSRCDSTENQTAQPETVIEPTEHPEPVLEQVQTEEKVVEQVLESSCKPEQSELVSPPAEKEHEPTEDELDRQKLVDIININITKFCRTVSYGCNETAQRKVRSVYNILSECDFAEDIYDKILCEGLQWFVEFHAEGEDIAEEDFGDADDLQYPSDRQLIPEKDSIVSKILHEVNAPKIERIDKSSENDTPPHKSSSESIDYSITRNKASRQKKKYVRTTNSEKKEVTDKDEKDDGNNKESAAPTASKDINIPKIEKAATTQLSPAQIAYLQGIQDLPVKKNVDVVKSMDVQTVRAKSVTFVECPEIINECSDVHSETKESKTRDPKVKRLFSPGVGVLRKSPNRLEVERKGSRELSIEMAERRIESQANRTFSDALLENKAKRRENSKRTERDNDGDSIVSRLMKEKMGEKQCTEEEIPKKGSVENVEQKLTVIGQNEKVVDEESKEPEVPTEEKEVDSSIITSSQKQTIKEVRTARERTESECSDTMPDLCSIDEEKEENIRIAEMKKELDDIKYKCGCTISFST